jgi:nucleotide-binding universal stress UspA family protein
MMAFKKILFPTDFSPQAERALAHAIRLAELENGEVIVQHVVNDYFERYPHWATLFDLHETQKQMDTYIETHMAETLPRGTLNARFRAVISKGRAADEINALAEKERVDLVVMGSAKGVITNQVIRLTHRPVLAVTARQPDVKDQDLRRIGRILVATDFSEHSKKVIGYAFDLKRVFDASIYMLYVIETSKAIDFGIRQGHLTGSVGKMREWATNQLVNLTPDEFIDDPGVVRIVEIGSPSGRIANVADEIAADLTIVGTHEHGTFHKHFIGTTTDKLLMKTSTPILTVRL